MNEWESCGLGNEKALSAIQFNLYAPSGCAKTYWIRIIKLKDYTVVVFRYSDNLRFKYILISIDIEIWMLLSDVVNVILIYKCFIFFDNKFALG